MSRFYNTDFAEMNCFSHQKMIFISYRNQYPAWKQILNLKKNCNIQGIGFFISLCYFLVLMLWQTIWYKFVYSCKPIEAHLPNQYTTLTILYNMLRRLLRRQQLSACTHDIETRLFSKFHKMILAAGKRSSEDIGPKEKPTFMHFEKCFKS